MTPNFSRIFEILKCWKESKKFTFQEYLKKKIKRYKFVTYPRWNYWKPLLYIVSAKLYGVPTMNELLSSKSRSKSLPIREILNNSIILFRSIDVEQSRANFPKLPPDTYHKEVLRNDTQKKHLSRAVYLTTRGGSTFFLASNIVPATEGIIIRSIKGGRG